AGPPRRTGRASRSTPRQRSRDHSRLVRPRRLPCGTEAAPARRPRPAIRPERPRGGEPDHGLHRRGAVLLLRRRLEAAARVHGVRGAGPGCEQQPGHRTDAGAVVDSVYFVSRRLVMHNEFLIVGPTGDSAGLRGLSDPVAALRRIAERGALFVSRGDQSGTHQREQLLWKRAGFSSPPRSVWYIESGQGMGATLQLADEKHGYTLTDRATYLTWRDKLQLVPMVEGDSLLYNVYHVLELNPKNASRINVAGGRALADFLVTPETQRLIGEYGKRRFGRSLFVPDAGKEP